MSAVLILAGWLLLLLAFFLLGRCALLLDSPDWTLPASAVLFVAAMMANVMGQRLRRTL